MNETTTRTVEVASVREVAEGVRELVLATPDGAPLPSWTPGAHVDLLLGDDLVRQYSLTASPDADAAAGRWTVAVLREPEGRGGSAYVHQRLAAGDRLAVRGPRNHFAWEPGAEHVFVAGGIGITPVLPMLAAAEEAGVAWTLHYGGRTRASMAYAGELVGRYGDKVVLHPQDEVGLLDLATVLGEPRPGLVVHACGPTGLLDALEKACVTFEPGTLHVERFSAAEGALEPGSGAEAFEVELADGRVLGVAADQSVLDALEAAGVEVLTSCREGTCGTCETEVLGGRVEHRDTILTAAEREANDVMFVCVSRAERGCSRLVLDR